MSRFPSNPNPFGMSGPRPREVSSDASSGALVSFFNAVYSWMAAGLAVTTLVAWWVSTRPDLMRTIFSGPMLIGLIVVELGLVFAISAAVNRIGAGVATLLFMLYAALNGLTLSALFLVYTHASLTGAFLVTAGTFAAMSVYGMVTRTDLTRLGSLLFMALIGLILATVVSLFWHNTILQTVINYAGVLIFVGLTAYDTQRLKDVAHATAGDARMAARYAINGALALYLDFVNLFLFLLRIFGDRR